MPCGEEGGRLVGLAFPKSSLEKMALALLPSLPQAMRNFLLLDSGNLPIAHSDGKKEK